MVSNKRKGGCVAHVPRRSSDGEHEITEVLPGHRIGTAQNEYSGGIKACSIAKQVVFLNQNGEHQWTCGVHYREVRNEVVAAVLLHRAKHVTEKSMLRFCSHKIIGNPCWGRFVKHGRELAKTVKGLLQGNIHVDVKTTKMVKHKISDGIGTHYGELVAIIGRKKPGIVSGDEISGCFISPQDVLVVRVKPFYRLLRIDPSLRNFFCLVCLMDDLWNHVVLRYLSGIIEFLNSDGPFHEPRIVQLGSHVPNLKINK